MTDAIVYDIHCDTIVPIFCLKIKYALKCNLYLFSTIYGKKVDSWQLYCLLRRW